MTDRPGHHAPIDYHAALLADPWRVAAWERAVRALVRPGDVVLDVGTGTGVMAVWAARAGAARVIAVESAWVAEVAREVVRRNGVEDVVEVVAEDLGALPPEPVDVILSDFVGRLLPEGDLRGAVQAAGAWAGPETRWAPSRVTLRGAPVADAPVPAVQRFAHPLLGVDLSAALPAAHGTTWNVQLPAQALAAEPAALGRLAPPDLPPRLSAEATWTLTRDGRLHGIAAWFDADLAPGVLLDTAPGRRTFWGQVLLPMPAVDARAGDTVSLALTATSLPGEIRFAWRVQVARDGARLLEHEGQTGDVAGPPVPPGPGLAVDAAGAVRAARAGREALRAGRARQAAEALGRAARLDPDTPDATHADHGRALLQAGQPGLAVPSLLRAIEHGDTAAALGDLVLALAQSGDPAAAAVLARYEAAFGAHPAVRRG